MSWEEMTGKKKMTDLRLDNVFEPPSRRISRRWTRSGTDLVIFLEAICAQTNLFWCEMKILTQEENFSTLAPHIKCSFYKYAKKVVYRLDFLKMNLLHKRKNDMF